MKKFANIYISLILFIIYIPVLVVVLYSFNASKLGTSWDGFSLMWYDKLFSNKQLLSALSNSLIIATVSSLVSALIATAGAVGLSKVKFKSRFLIENMTIIPLMIPEIIMGMAFLSYFSLLKLKFGMLTIILAHCSFCIPYTFLLVKSQLAMMDKYTEEAALDLGASDIRTFFDITLPQIMPSVISGILLSFAMSLDDVVISFFVTGSSTNTLPVKIFSQLKMGVTPDVNALCTIILAVVFTIAFTLITRFNKR